MVFLALFLSRAACNANNTFHIPHKTYAKHPFVKVKQITTIKQKR